MILCHLVSIQFPIPGEHWITSDTINSELNEEST